MPQLRAGERLSSQDTGHLGFFSPLHIVLSREGRTCPSVCSKEVATISLAMPPSHLVDESPLQLSEVVYGPCLAQLLTIKMGDVSVDAAAVLVYTYC